MQHFGNKTHLNTRVTTQNQTSENVTTFTEQQMIALCKRGDRAAQKALFDSLSKKMFPLCIRYMGDRDAAEDVLQEGFISLFSKLDSYSGEGSFEGWARKVFVNTALMTLRRNDVMKQTEDIEIARNVTGSETSALQDMSYKELLDVVAELPPPRPEASASVRDRNPYICRSASYFCLFILFCNMTLARWSCDREVASEIPRISLISL